MAPCTSGHTPISLRDSHLDVNPNLSPAWCFPFVYLCNFGCFIYLKKAEFWVFQALTRADSMEKIAVTSPSSEEKALSLWVQSLGIADICCWFSFMVCDPGSAHHPGYPSWNELGKALKVLGELPSSPKQAYSNSHSPGFNA